MTGAGRTGRDALIFVVVCGVSLALVGLLWLLARDADSAGTSGPIEQVALPNYTADEVCQNWAGYWIDASGVDPPPEVLERMSNCRQTNAGAWIAAESGAEAGLVRPVVLSDAQRSRVAPLESAIRVQIRSFFDTMSPDLQNGLGRIYDPDAKGVTPHIRDGEPIGTVRRLHGEEMNAFIGRPGNEELAAYVAWAMAERQAAFATFREACLAPGLTYLVRTCDGTGDWLSVAHIPWYWDLGSPLLLDRYLLGVAEGTIDPVADPV